MILKFKNIQAWLTFVIQAEDQELDKIMDESFILEDLIEEEIIIGSDELILKFKERLSGHKHEHQLWKETLYNYFKPLPDPICMYLMDHTIAIEALGHTAVSDKILWILGELVDEAVLTLGKRIYTSDLYPLKDFKKLLDKFYNNSSLWESLIHMFPSDNAKQAYLYQQLDNRTDFEDIKQQKLEKVAKAIYTDECYSFEEFKKILDLNYTNYNLWLILSHINSPNELKQGYFNAQLDAKADFEEIKQLKQELEIEKMLSITDNVDTIRQYYASGKPRFLVSIALNPNTPLDILDELLKMSQVEQAKNIRTNVRKNIKRNKN